jgi:putative ABC transport system permease protein
VTGTLLRKTRKEIFGQRGKVASSLTLVFLGVFCYVAFSAMIPTMHASIDYTYNEYAAPNFMAVVYSVPRAHIDGIRNIDGVQNFTSRYHIFGEVSYEGSQITPADIYGIDTMSPPSVFKLLLTDGSFFNQTNNHTILMERSFAEQNGLSVGSSLNISMFGKSYDVKIVGLVLSLEHLLPHRNPKQLIYAPSRVSFSTIAPIWIDISVLQNLAYSGSGDKDVVNEILVRYEDNTNYTTLSTAVLDVIAPYPVVTTLDTNGLRSSELQRFDIADDFIALFSGLIFAVGAFVIYITVRRIIESNSRQIGITRSLGYRTSEIQRSYLLILGGMAFLVTLVALPISPLGGKAIIAAALAIYSIPVQDAVVSDMVYIVGFIAGPTTVLISAYFPTRRISSYEPVRAIRGMMMEKGYVGDTILEKIGRRLGYAGYGFKYVARGLSLNKTRAGLMIVGIALAAGVAFMGSSVVGGFNNSIATYMGQYEQWDLLIDFKEPLNATQVATIVSSVHDIKAYEPYLKISANTIVSGLPSLVSLLCLNTSESLHRFNLESGHNIEGPRDVLVDVSIADTMGIKQDDVLNITLGNSTDQFTVVGIVSSPMNVMYLSLSEASILLGHEMISGLFVKVAASTSPEDVATAIFSLQDVESAMTRSEATSGVIGEAQGIAIAIGMSGIAMALLLAVVWNIVSISTEERIPELAQLEAIGWSRNSLSRLLLLEVMIVSLIGCFLSILTGWLFTQLFNGFMKTFIPFYAAAFDLVMFFGVSVLTILTAAIATIPAIRRLRRIDIDRVIRERLMT